MKQNNAIYAVLLLAIIGTAFIALMSWEDQPPAPAPVVINENATFSGNLEREGDTRFHSIRVSENVTSIHFILECPGVDFDFYGSYGELPSTEDYDIIGYSSTGENFYHEDPEPGIWHLMVHSYSATGHYDLIIEFEYQ